MYSALDTDTSWFIKRFGKERNKFKVTETRKYKETGCINSVQSSLKSHLVWVTLMINPDDVTALTIMK